MQSELTKLKREVLISFHRRELKLLENTEPACCNCLHVGAGGVCTKWKMQPPEEVAKVGCDDWAHDPIPF